MKCRKMAVERGGKKGGWYEGRGDIIISKLTEGEQTCAGPALCAGGGAGLEGRGGHRSKQNIQWLDDPVSGSGVQGQPLPKAEVVHSQKRGDGVKKPHKGRKRSAASDVGSATYAR